MSIRETKLNMSRFNPGDRVRVTAIEGHPLATVERKALTLGQVEYWLKFDDPSILKTFDHPEDKKDGGEWVADELEPADAKDWLVTVHETHAQRVRVRARDDLDASRLVRDGGGEYERDLDGYVTTPVEAEETVIKNVRLATEDDRWTEVKDGQEILNYENMRIDQDGPRDFAYWLLIHALAHHKPRDPEKRAVLDKLMAKRLPVELRIGGVPFAFEKVMARLHEVHEDLVEARARDLLKERLDDTLETFNEKSEAVFEAMEDLKRKLGERARSVLPRAKTEEE